MTQRHLRGLFTALILLAAAGPARADSANAPQVDTYFGEITVTSGGPPTRGTVSTSLFREPDGAVAGTYRYRFGQDDVPATGRLRKEGTTAQGAIRLSFSDATGSGEVVIGTTNRWRTFSGTWTQDDGGAGTWTGALLGDTEPAAAVMPTDRPGPEPGRAYRGLVTLGAAHAGDVTTSFDTGGGQTGTYTYRFADDPPGAERSGRLGLLGPAGPDGLAYRFEEPDSRGVVVVRFQADGHAFEGQWGNATGDGGDWSGHLETP